jgi:putative nucleotidyltransferase with HDIG domain
MSIPSREQAVGVLLDLRPAAGLLRHMTVVGEIATDLALRLAKNGVPIDRRLAETAALLHDVDKALPTSDPLRTMGHGYAGAEWLKRHGLAELASAVAWHPVSRLGDDETYQRLLTEADWEIKVVAYADKRAIQRVVSLDARFARWERRHTDMRDSLARARQRAGDLETEICTAAGIRPRDVKRLRWVRTTMARGRARAA